MQLIVCDFDACVDSTNDQKNRQNERYNNSRAYTMVSLPRHCVTIHRSLSVKSGPSLPPHLITSIDLPTTSSNHRISDSQRRPCPSSRNLRGRCRSSVTAYRIAVMRKSSIKRSIPPHHLPQPSSNPAQHFPFSPKPNHPPPPAGHPPSHHHHNPRPP